MRVMTATIAFAVALVMAVTEFPTTGQSRDEEALRDFVSDFLDALDATESIEEEVMREAVDPCIARSRKGG